MDKSGTTIGRERIQLAQIGFSAAIVALMILGLMAYKSIAAFQTNSEQIARTDILQGPRRDEADDDHPE